MCGSHMDNKIIYVVRIYRRDKCMNIVSVLKIGLNVR
jgi:hypothetical protein